MKKFREFLYTEKLQEIISQLDENLFLEGKRVQEALRQKGERFLLGRVMKEIPID